MTKKDYIKIAWVFREAKTVTDISHIVSEFLTMLKIDNPRFNEDEFLKAIYK